MSSRQNNCRRGCGGLDDEDSLSSEVDALLDGPPRDNVDFVSSGTAELLDQLVGNPPDISLSEVSFCAALLKSHRM